VRNVGAALRALEPEVYLPSAGPVVFPFLPADFDSDPAATTFVHQTVLAEQLEAPPSTRVAYLRPGETLSDDVGSEPIPPPTRAEIDAYATDLIDRWSSSDDVLDRRLLLNEVEARLALLADHDLGQPPLVEFVWGEGPSDRLLIDLAGGQARFGEVAPEDSEVTVIRASERYFQLLATVDRWQEVVHSFRARVTRRPDVFNNAVNLFLYSDKQTLSESLGGVASDRFEVTSDGRRFELDRRCPHQGADLSHGSFEDGCVVCPRHGWRFDLSNGGRDARSGTSVNAVEVANSRRS
jgi:UDP-MurNAc hydroxylase